MSRNMLHVTALDDFKLWLDANSIPHRPGRGDYQVLQVCKDGQHWNCIYWRHHMPEHYTADRHLDSIVARFCRDRRNARNTA